MIYGGGLSASCYGSESFVLCFLEFLWVGFRYGWELGYGGTVYSSPYELFVENGKGYFLSANIFFFRKGFKSIYFSYGFLVVEVK